MSIEEKAYQMPHSRKSRFRKITEILTKDRRNASRELIRELFQTWKQYISPQFTDETCGSCVNEMINKSGTIVKSWQQERKKLKSLHAKQV